MILAWIAIAVIGGVLLGQVFVLPPVAAALLVAACTALALALRVRPHAKLLILAAALLIGIARSPHQAPATHSQTAFYNGTSVQLVGVVDAEPDIRDTGANYVISVQQITRNGHQIPLSGSVTVHTTRAIQLDYGDRVSLVGRLEAPRNTSRLPWADILARQGILSEMRFPRLLNLGATTPGPLGWLIALRQYLERGINAWLPEPEAALLIAITLGAKSASLGNLAPSLVSTGLIHLIAISGIKVAVVAGIIYQLAKSSGNRLATLAIGLSAVWFYVLLTGATASGVRAAIIWSLLFLAAYLGRATVALVSLSFAASLMVLLDPSVLWDLGFQLSIFGTFFIVALSDPIQRVLGMVPTPFREALGVSLAAQIGTLPLVIAGFHVVSLDGPLTNALVLPLLPLLIIVGFLLGLVSGLAAVAAPLSALAYTLTHAVVALAHTFAQLPAPTASSSALASIAYYVVLTGVALRLLRRANWFPLGRITHVRREVALASVLGLSTLSMSLFTLPHQSGTHLYWLGTGNSLLLISNGKTALIDGSPTPFTLLERLGEVLPFDRRTIDLLVLTDPRFANITAVDEVAQHYSVGEVLDVGAEYPSGGYASWRAELRRRGIPVYRMRTGNSVLVGNARLLSLGPDGLYSNPVDSIGLIKIVAPGESWLLLGGSSTRQQTEALFRPVDLRSNTIFTDNKRPAAEFIKTVAATKIYGPWNLSGGKTQDLSGR